MYPVPSIHGRDHDLPGSQTRHYYLHRFWCFGPGKMSVRSYEIYGPTREV
jgi:hypothetical protein